MDQLWFEMPDIRRRGLSNAVWIPLRASHQIERIGKYGYLGSLLPAFMRKPEMLRLMPTARSPLH